MDYGDIFVSVRQRVAAFMYFKDFCSDYGWSYGAETEPEYLDAAFRFLNMPARADFIAYCAGREKMGFSEYCEDMEIDKSKLARGDENYTTLRCRDGL